MNPKPLTPALIDYADKISNLQSPAVEPSASHPNAHCHYQRIFSMLLATCFACCVMLLGGFFTVAKAATDLCFASLDGVTTHASSADGQALRTAVFNATGNGTVYVAGTCAGVTGNGVISQVVSIGQPLTLIGGYKAISGTGTVDWSVHDFATYPTTIDAQNQGRVIYTSHALKLESLVIRNGYVLNGNGGGIYAASDLWLVSTYISNSIASGVSTNGNGGGVYVNGNATITGTSFLSNSVSGAWPDGFGGGAHIVGVAAITMTIFQKNNASNLGGGAFVGGVASVTGTSFYTNSADFYGGGIHVDGIASVTGATFQSNSSPVGGGASLARNATIADTTFVSNIAEYGGGARIGGSGSIIRTTFQSNTADYLGGAVYVVGDATLTDATITSNSAGNDGGGLYVLGKATVTDAIFSKNGAIVKGGGVYVHGFATLVASNFNKNSAQIGGGAFVNSSAEVNGTSFLTNTATYDGGAIHIAGNATIASSTFISNTASSFGGALYSGAAAVIEQTSFQSNTTSGDGGGAYIFGNGTLTSATFSGNTATSDGGGANIRGSVTSTATTFKNNKAAWGAGLYGRGSGTLTGGSFLTNTASVGAGGGALVWGSTAVTGTTFLNNAAANAWGGGGLAIWEQAGAIDSSYFEKNRAGSGGGLWIQSGSGWLTNTTFYDNNTTAYWPEGFGGGAYVGGDASVSGGRFDLNTAYVLGAGLYVAGDTMMMETSVTRNNAYDFGAGAYLAGDANLNGITFQSNSAGNDGGGVIVDGNATVVATTFRSNTASDFGGGAIISGSITATDTSFILNSATDKAGGLLVYGSAALMTTKFFTNTSAVYGGLYVAGNATVNSSLFQANKATLTSGGGAYVVGTVMVSGTSFISNTAALAGGALYLEGSSATPMRVVNSIFARNRALAEAGDDIYMAGLLSNSHLALLHSVSANRVIDGGSGIYVNGGTVGITNTIFASHTVAIEQAGGTVYEDYNLFFNNFDTGTGTGSSVTSGLHSLTGDPAFVDPTKDDYRLLTNSSAIEQGIAIGVTEDFDGQLRPKGLRPDIGAFELDAAVITVTTVVVGGSAQPADFALSLSGFGPIVNGIATAVRVGAYSVSEVTLPGYVATISGDCGADGQIVLVANQQANCLITNTAIEMSIDDITVDEGNSGTSMAEFTIQLSTTPVQTVTVNYVTTDDTALSPLDYMGGNGTIVFAPGETEKVINIEVIGDLVDESDEAFAITLSNVQGAFLNDAGAIATLSNDDVVEFIVPDLLVAEGNSGTTEVTFIINLSNPVDRDVTLTYYSSDDIAVAGVDYNATSGTLVVPAGETSTSIPVTILGDSDFENDESFIIPIFRFDTQLVAEALGFILNDDAEPISTPTPTFTPTPTEVPGSTPTATPLPNSDLQLQLYSTPAQGSSVVLGDLITYFATLTNVGSNPATNIVLSVQLPTHLQLEPLSVIPPTSTVTAETGVVATTADAGQLIWRVSELAGGGAQFQASFTARAMQVLPVTVMAQATSNQVTTAQEQSVQHTVLPTSPGGGSSSIYLPIITK